jgi:hypothetical protein
MSPACHSVCVTKGVTGYYPQLIALYTHLGISFQRSNFSYSFSFLNALPPQRTEGSEKDSVHLAAFSIRPTIIYDGASGRAGISVPTVLKQVYTTLPRRTFQRGWARLKFFVTFALSMATLVFFFLRLQFLASPWLRGKNNSRELSWAEWAKHMTPRDPLSRMTGLDARWQDVCARRVCTSFLCGLYCAAEGHRRTPSRRASRYVESLF